ncbi:FAD-dependent oxidoreductase, partial [Streptomyces tendae]
MLEPAYQADVVVVGAGIAGLAAAQRLTSAGVTTTVLEAAHAVGGRMATEKVDGFRLDRIGQLLSSRSLLHGSGARRFGCEGQSLRHRWSSRSLPL